VAHAQRHEFQTRRDWLKTGRFGRHRFWEFLERSKNSASSGEWEEGEKGQTGYLKNPQQGKNPNQHQKWTTFLEPSKTKHIFGLSGRLLFRAWKGAKK